MKNKILIIEDDERLADFMSTYLQNNGYIVTLITKGDTAIDHLTKDIPALIIIDLMLPGVDGLELCRTLRPNYAGKIIILTASEGPADEIICLELGADDYLKKPIEPRLLLARVKAHLRTTHTHKKNEQDLNYEDTRSKSLVFGELKICSTTREVKLKGKTIDISSTEFDLLWLLATHAGSTLSRDEIFAKIRGIDYNGFDRSIDARICRIRKKIEDSEPNPTRIKTVRGKGYLFTPDNRD